MSDEGLTPAEMLWESLWSAIADARDAGPRTPQDVDSGAIVDAVVPIIDRYALDQTIATLRLNADSIRQSIQAGDLNATEIAVKHIRVDTLEALAAEIEASLR